MAPNVTEREKMQRIRPGFKPCPLNLQSGDLPTELSGHRRSNYLWNKNTWKHIFNLSEYYDSFKWYNKTNAYKVYDPFMYMSHGLCFLFLALCFWIISMFSCFIVDFQKWLIRSPHNCSFRLLLLGGGGGVKIKFWLLAYRLFMPDRLWKLTNSLQFLDKYIAI